jgi:patatin-like phospholipase/acyl hydrolase
MAYRILCFDGGGTRGLYMAVLFERLCREIPELVDRADLLAGTSAGALIALGLALGRTPEFMATTYRQRARRIFDDSWLDNIKDLGQLVGAQYENTELRRLCEEVGGATRMKELQKRVLVPAFQLDNRLPGRSWKPKFFHNILPPEGVHLDDSDAEELVVDVALRSSAAPSYFPTYQGYADGGLVANNPSMAAIALALDVRAGNQHLRDVRVLSVGMGTVPKYVDAGASGRLDWGVAQWAFPLIHILFEGVMGVADYQCRQLLGARYHRLSPLLPRDLALDDVKHLDELAGWAMREDIAPTVAWIREEFLAA